MVGFPLLFISGVSSLCSTYIKVFNQNAIDLLCTHKQLQTEAHCNNSHLDSSILSSLLFLLALLRNRCLWKKSKLINQKNSLFTINVIKERTANCEMYTL